MSARQHQEVSEHERQYQDGSDPAVMDVIDVPLLKPAPEKFQQENWLLDPAYYWEKVGTTSWDGLAALLDPIEPLWVDGHSTFYGSNDQVPEDLAISLTSSLRLVRVARVRLRVFAPGASFGDPKRRVQARFEHAGVTYALRVTDPVYERRFLAKANGFYDLGESFLTVSLGEAWQGSAYKLIAAIIENSAN